MLDSRFLLEGASDADIGANSIVTYRLDSNDYFTLIVNSKNEENKQVELVLRKSLDREDAPEHKLLLTATDGGKPELTGSVQLLVTVLDVNDNAPTFQQSEYEVRILENSDNGTTVIRLNASDRDEGTNSAISYSFNRLVPSMVLEQFSIDTDTGEIIIQGNLDFEQVNVYKIRVDATDKGHPPMAGHCTVLVKVLDENDNVPQVTLTSLSLPVREDAALGTVIALISVSDLDSGANGQVTCSLTPHVPFKLVSTFKNYYSLVLDSALDRETTADYKVVVTARDGGSPSLWATASVSVEVADVNDNAPAFAQPEYTVFVKENNPPGAHIFTVSATDADVQENALVSYSLVERRVGERLLSSFVSVHAESGKVFALQPLDHEELELLQFQIKDIHLWWLTALYSWKSWMKTITHPSLSLPVREDAQLGTVIALISVTDPDSTVNGQVTCSLTPHVPFKLVSTFKNYYSLVLDSALDRETVANYYVVVTARDGGSPSLWATASVSVEVADVNDNAPAFAQPEYTVFVKENNPPGAHIFTVSATDADTQENALVSYSLVERRVGERLLSSFVSVHAESGKVFALQPLDHEELELLQFQTSGRVSVPEASLVTVNVYLIIAICAVSSLLVLTLLLYTALRCSATPTEGACAPGKPVLVCSSAVGTWSYSQQRRQRVCSGEGPPKTDLMAFSPSLPQGPNSTDNVSLRGQRVCSGVCPPKVDLMAFSPSLPPNLDRDERERQESESNHSGPGAASCGYFIIIEDKRGTFVDNIAQDPGLGLAQLVRCLFRVASKDRGDFRSALDHKITAQLTDYKVVVTARDGGSPSLWATASVSVEVADVNDNAPAFAQPEYTVFVKENNPPGAHIFTVLATDADAQENALVSYSLVERRVGERLLSSLESVHRESSKVFAW
ncbi:Protocadherin alpha-8 [Cricetulus griseus]|uniref:Protocadherin alpha-8 n=1 Tax=Cricetulus griseus TaxID=10029 RepID=G3I8P4_CRIGR|nr:Protocadherin alpha-8 [Cricetulus griseus]